MFLGTGTSHGVPMIGCGCDTCQSDDPRNKRTRCGVALGLPEGTLLIDTPPELRLQLTREKIGLVNAILLTHGHADHLFGMDDVRIFPRYTGWDIPVYAKPDVLEVVRSSFPYAFEESSRRIGPGGLPRIDLRPLDGDPLHLLGATVTPLPLRHGRFESTGFRFGQVAYCTDFKTLSDSTKRLLCDLDTLVLGCLRYHPHVAHLCLDEALELIDELRPKKTYLTHIAHNFEHSRVSRELPENVQLAYDGLRIPLT